ncbi:MAG: phosphatase PAP2 family protein [Desulfovibrionales bacterium]
MFSLPALDWSLFSLINQEWRNPVFDWIMAFLSHDLTYWILGISALLWALVSKNRKLILNLIFIAMIMGVTDLWTNGIKHATGRVRPYKAEPGVFYLRDDDWTRRPENFIPKKEDGRSFPSAHAANSMAFAVAVLLLWPGKRKKFAILILPLAVGYSRIYLGKHFPFDVLGGWCVGAFTASLLILLPSRFSLTFRSLIDLRPPKTGDPPCTCGTEQPPTRRTPEKGSD